LTDTLAQVGSSLLSMGNTIANLFGVRPYTVTIRTEAWSVAVGQGTVTNTDTSVTPPPVVEQNRGDTRSWFQQGVFSNATGNLTVASYRVRVPKAFTQPSPGGYTTAALLQSSSVTSRTLMILAGDGLLQLSRYANGEPFLIAYIDNSNPLLSDFYLERAPALVT
jgi:hypothetical protein